MVDKRERFVELAEKRVNRAIDDIRLIGNLSNRHNYEYTDADARKILAALDGEVRVLKRRFASGTPDNKPSFKL